MLSNVATETRTVGLVGARGHVGAELVTLLAQHPAFRLSYASSRALAGERVEGHAAASSSELRFEDLPPEAIADREADLVILAVPNGAASEYANVLLERGDDAPVIIDMSADYRFDDNWVYGLTEHTRERLATATRISNPGCYATAAQLAIRPLLSLLAAPPHCFGISGYSGAGTTPSPKNDPVVLEHGLLPYQLVDHLHEREMERQLGVPVRFSPHVAAFFRGISMTTQATLLEGTTPEEITDVYRAAYDGCKMIDVVGESAPRVQGVAHRDGARIGGISVHPRDPTRVAVVSVIDNLRKGAASQAIQNANLALGLPEHTGLHA